MDIEIPAGFDVHRPTVLCISSLQFNRDIVELQKSSKRHIWTALPDLALTEAQRRWVPPRLQVQGLYVNETGPDVDAIWAKSKRFGLSILTSLMTKGVKISAVMAGNWDYWNEECIRPACTELGIPFLVLMREHDLTENRWKDAYDFWGQTPPPKQIAAVATAGESTNELLEGMKLFPQTKLRATGWPRLDCWSRPAVPLHDRPIVFMSYFKGYRADKHAVRMFDLFSVLAGQYPHVPFVVKAKHVMEAELLRKAAAHRGISNLEIMDTLNLRSLLCNARAVFGFHSMSLYEALLSPARILIPQWGETAIDWQLQAPSPRDTRLHGHMEFVESEDALVQVLCKCAESDTPTPDMAERTRLFGQYVRYDPNYNAVDRVEDFIDEFALKTSSH